MYATKKKMKGNLNARKVTDLVIAAFGLSPSARDIQRYAKDGIVGQSPLKKGRVGDLYPFVFNVLCTYFDIFVKINQTNGQDGENYH